MSCPYKTGNNFMGGKVCYVPGITVHFYNTSDIVSVLISAVKEIFEETAKIIAKKSRQKKLSKVLNLSDKKS